MNTQHWYALIGTLGTVIQSVAAGFFIYDRIQPKPQKAIMVSTKGRAILVTVLLVISVAFGGFLSHWLWTFTPTPAVVTGAATTRGAQSPANSGSGNTTTYGSLPTPPK